MLASTQEGIANKKVNSIQFQVQGCRDKKPVDGNYYKEDANLQCFPPSSCLLKAQQAKVVHSVSCVCK